MGPMAHGRQVDHGLNRRDFKGFLLAQWWQQAGQTAGKQGLAGAGWPAEQQVVVKYTQFNIDVLANDQQT